MNQDDRIEDGDPRVPTWAKRQAGINMRGDAGLKSRMEDQFGVEYCREHFPWAYVDLKTDQEITREIEAGDASQA